MAAIGTQTGGSILRPAAYCGVCGLKPSYSPEMLGGIAPVSFHLDHVGPIARTIADLGQLFNVLIGYSPVGGELPLRMSLVGDFFRDEASPEVCRVIDSAWNQIATELLPLPRPQLPKNFRSVHECHWRVMAVEAGEVHRIAFAENSLAFGVNVRALIREGLSANLHDYVAALKHQQDFQRDLSLAMSAPQLWVMPSTTTTAPDTSTTGDSRFNSPWSYAGVPAITLPCGLSNEGLSVGLQIVGPRGADEDVLEAAAWIEERIGFTARPALLD